MTTQKNAAKKAAQKDTPKLSPEEIAAKRAEAKARVQETPPAEPAANLSEAYNKVVAVSNFHELSEFSTLTEAPAEQPAEATEKPVYVPSEADKKAAEELGWPPFDEPAETAEEAEERQASEEMEQAAHEAALEEEADRIAALEAKEADSQTFIPEVMVQVATEIKEVLTVDFVESSNKADEAMRAAAIAREEALQAGRALLMANAELKKAREEAEEAKREAQAAREAAAIAAEQSETNKRLAPKILAAERAERIAAAAAMTNVIEKLTARHTLLETILKTAEDNISVVIKGSARQEVEIYNKTICKDIAEQLLEKVKEAITRQENELNAFAI